MKGQTIMCDDLLERLDIKVLNGKFKCTQVIKTGMGARCFFGENIETGENVFIKFLLFPRSKTESSRFENEIFTLQYLSNNPITVSPKFIDHGRLYNDEILYLITEKVDGTSLEVWIEKKLPTSDINERLEVFHRVTSTVAHYVSIFSHRDLHPGNILLLDKAPNFHGKLPKTEVRILDWGHSFGPLLAHFDDSPDFLLDLYERIPKEITGSFYCMPPDVLFQWGKAIYNPGKHDAWSLGLLLYKLLLGENLFNFSGVGDFSECLKNGEMEGILNSATANVESLDHPSANIISEVFKGLTKIKPELRMDSATAGRIMFDVRIEGLTLSTTKELKTYIMDPYNYMPKDGWKFSDWPDYE